MATSRQISSLARSKAARECSRPEHDLRILLGHIQVLDHVERHPTDLYQQQRSIRQPPPVTHHEPGHVTKQPETLKLINSAPVTSGTIPPTDGVSLSAVSAVPALVTVEELTDDDWDA